MNKRPWNAATLGVAAVLVTKTLIAGDAVLAASEEFQSSAHELIGLPYDQARSIILTNGWQPFENPVADDLAFVARGLYEDGYVEVATCSPVGEAPCKLYFQEPAGRYLEVMTIGEFPHVAQVNILSAGEFEQMRMLLWGE
ncbi:hypothetical protein FMN63_10940 [Stappia sp. BW2]|jgi:hypothetical protein|uniref:hypothetical protein n=1 Tax=Stappia sp. BW2 TaxID=2592622 RepID=UPI0011DEA3B4|nr:hypothetical protein [Stappia sp. BW2]TYC69138.1 hypothetical protein FMN63_10940 [Stappia sp. BW2]